jgi:hypothetical protein
MKRLVMVLMLAVLVAGALVPSPTSAKSVDSSLGAGPGQGPSGALLDLASRLSVQRTGSRGPVAAPQAVSRYGCAWPRVCFYTSYNAWFNHRPTAAYRDMYWQYLSAAAYDPLMVYNSRNDDGARLYYWTDDGDSSWFCLIPNAWVDPWDEISWSRAHIYAIDITDDPDCVYQ